MIDRRLLAVLILISAIAPISIDTYLPVLPEVGGDLVAGFSAVQLTLTTFVYGLGTGQLLIGPLSDRFGRRRPLLVGTVVCALASAGCALAPTIEVLVGMRFVQGAAGAAGVVIARAVIADRVTGRAATRLFGIAAAVQGLAPVVAPLLGGALAPAFGWRGIFWVLTAITTVMAAGVAAIVPETLPVQHRRGGSGYVRSFGAVLRLREFLAPTLTYAFGFAVLFAYIAASSFVLRGQLGLSVGWYAITFAGSALALAASSAVSARLVVRIDPRRLIGVGLGLLIAISVGLVLVTSTMRLDAGAGQILVLVLLFASTAALGQVFGNSTGLALHAARGRFGAGSALLGALQFGIGGLAAPLAGETVQRMALTMTGAAAAAAAVHLWGSRPVTTRG